MVRRALRRHCDRFDLVAFSVRDFLVAVRAWLILSHDSTKDRPFSLPRGGLRGLI
jgi:hypothetical protein